MKNNNNEKIKDIMEEHEHFIAMDERDLEVINDDNDYYTYKYNNCYPYYKKRLSYEEEQIARGY